MLGFGKGKAKKEKKLKLGKRWEFQNKDLDRIWRYLKEAQANKVGQKEYFEFRTDLSKMIPETEGKVIQLDIEKTTGRPYVCEVLE